MMNSLIICFFFFFDIFRVLAVWLVISIAEAFIFFAQGILRDCLFLRVFVSGLVTMLILD